MESLSVGDEIQCFARGVKSRNGGTPIGLVAFGVGITEALPIAAAELEHSNVQRVKLIWAKKTWGDVFWLDQIDRLTAEHGERFEVVHVLSQAERDGCRRGRVDPELLTAGLDEAWGGGAAFDRARALGLDFVTSLSGAATAISNVGPGLGSTIGPGGTFADLPDAAKWMLSAGMLLGRLELFTVLVILTPAFWRT